MRHKDYFKILALCIVMAGCSDDGQNPVQESPEGETSEEQLPGEPVVAVDENSSIKEIINNLYPEGKFYIGAASLKDYYENPSNKMARRFFEEIPHNTPNNSFKQVVVNPNNQDGYWNSMEYSFFIYQAYKYGQTIRAHGPISPQCSRWIRDDVRTAAELTDALKNYMITLSKDLEENKDIVKWMDVVNEVCVHDRQGGILGYDGKPTEKPFFEPGDWFGPKENISDWENPWTIIGFDDVQIDGKPFSFPSYIRMAFEYANQYAPGVKKIFNTQTLIPEATEKIKKVITYLRNEKGLTIDGIAWQAHVKIDWGSEKDIKELNDMIAWCAENNLEFHISELDVNKTKKSDNKPVKPGEYPDMDKTQSDIICKIAEICLQNIDRNVKGINFWGISDDEEKGRIWDENGDDNLAGKNLKKLLVKYGKTNN